MTWEDRLREIESLTRVTARVQVPELLCGFPLQLLAAGWGQGVQQPTGKLEVFGVHAVYKPPGRPLRFLQAFREAGQGRFGDLHQLGGFAFGLPGVWAQEAPVPEAAEGAQDGRPAEAGLGHEAFDSAAAGTGPQAASHTRRR